jgi:gas vesicle protein
MVEIPRKASLSEELIKFAFWSSTFLLVTLFMVLIGLGDLDFKYALLVSIPISLGWTFILLSWLKGRIESILGRLVYIVDLMEQSKHGRVVAAVPIYEEMLVIIDSIRDILSGVESKCDREIKELQEQLDMIAENTSQIIDRLQMLSEGNMDIEFPSGLDLSGAIGQALNQSLAEIRKRLLYVKEAVQNLYDRTQNLLEDCEHIRDKNLREEIYNILKEEEKILEKLEFFKC